MTSCIRAWPCTSVQLPLCLSIATARRLEGGDDDEIQELQQPLLGDGGAGDQHESLMSRARKVRRETCFRHCTSVEQDVWPCCRITARMQHGRHQS